MNLRNYKLNHIFISSRNEQVRTKRKNSHQGRTKQKKNENGLIPRAESRRVSHTYLLAIKIVKKNSFSHVLPETLCYWAIASEAERKYWMTCALQTKEALRQKANPAEDANEWRVVESERKGETNAHTIFFLLFHYAFALRSLQSRLTLRGWYGGGSVRREGERERERKREFGNSRREGGKWEQRHQLRAFGRCSEKGEQNVLGPSSVHVTATVERTSGWGRRITHKRSTDSNSPVSSDGELELRHWLLGCCAFSGCIEPRPFTHVLPCRGSLDSRCRRERNKRGIFFFCTARLISLPIGRPNNERRHLLYSDWLVL